MAKRRKLADLVKQETERSQSDSEVTDLQSSEVTELQTPEVTDSQADRAAKSQPTEVTELQTPDLRTTEVPNDRTHSDTDLQSSELTELQTSKLTDSQSDKKRTSKLTDSRTAQVPKYLALVRKETRLREDQIDRLTTRARKLNRAKRGGERITENTLIRVAVDLLLDRSESLSGTDEAALLNSLGLEVTD